MNIQIGEKSYTSKKWAAFPKRIDLIEWVKPVGMAGGDKGKAARKRL
jgi:hypothetical protein